MFAASLLSPVVPTKVNAVIYSGGVSSKRKRRNNSPKIHLVRSDVCLNEEYYSADEGVSYSLDRQNGTNKSLHRSSNFKVRDFEPATSQRHVEPVGLSTVADGTFEGKPTKTDPKSNKTKYQNHGIEIVIGNEIAKGIRGLTAMLPDPVLIGLGPRISISAKQSRS